MEVLAEQGIKPGIKVDTGLQQLPGTPGETATQGLDGLGDRMKAYREQVCACPPSLPLEGGPFLLLLAAWRWHSRSNLQPGGRARRDALQCKPVDFLPSVGCWVCQGVPGCTRHGGWA